QVAVALGLRYAVGDELVRPSEERRLELDLFGTARADRGDVRPRRDPRRHDEGSRDRKSTRLNSSHVSISYAVFCLKKKKTENHLDKAAIAAPCLRIKSNSTAAAN